MGEREETTDFTDEHGSRFAQRLRQDRLALNRDLDRDLSPNNRLPEKFPYTHQPPNRSIPNS